MDRTSWLRELQRDCEAKYDDYAPLYWEKYAGFTHYEPAINVIYYAHMYLIANKDREHGIRDQHITSLWASS
jgi:hypothetical protein